MQKTELKPQCQLKSILLIKSGLQPKMLVSGMAISMLPFILLENENYIIVMLMDGLACNRMVEKLVILLKFINFVV